MNYVCHLRIFRTVSSQIRNCHYDVAIVGGGMIGMAMAAKLGTMTELDKKRIILIEKGKQPSYVKSEDHFLTRVVAINKGSQTLLNDVKAWEIIRKNRFCRITSMHVWEDDPSNSINFESTFEFPEVAFAVENELLRFSSMKVAAERENITLLFEKESKILDFPKDECQPKPVVLQVGEDRQISCDLLIGADGCFSNVRSSYGLRSLIYDYGQSVIVGNARLAEGLKNREAWQRFGQTGPIGMFPTTDNTVSIAWYMGDEEVEKALGKGNDNFVACFNQKMGSCGNLRNGTRGPPRIETVDVGELRAIHVNFQHAVNSVGSRVVLIGDAGHRVNPMSGQGANLGFGDVDALGEVLGKAIRLGDDIGNVHVLKKYERERRPHTVLMSMGVEAIRMFFGLPMPYKSLILNSINGLSLVKSQILGFAQR